MTGTALVHRAREGVVGLGGAARLGAARWRSPRRRGARARRRGCSRGAGRPCGSGTRPRRASSAAAPGWNASRGRRATRGRAPPGRCRRGGGRPRGTPRAARPGRGRPPRPAWPRSRPRPGSRPSSTWPRRSPARRPLRYVASRSPAVRQPSQGQTASAPTATSSAQWWMSHTPASATMPTRWRRPAFTRASWRRLDRAQRGDGGARTRPPRGR